MKAENIFKQFCDSVDRSKKGWKKIDKVSTKLKNILSEEKRVETKCTLTAELILLLVEQLSPVSSPNANKILKDVLKDIDDDD